MYNNFVPTRGTDYAHPIATHTPLRGFQTFQRHYIDTYKLQNSAYQRPHTHNHAHGISCLLVRRIQNWFYLPTYFILLGHPNKSFRNWWILHCPYIQSNSAISTDWMVKVVQVWENNYSTRVGSDSKKKRLFVSLQIKASVGALN